MGAKLASAWSRPLSCLAWVNLVLHGAGLVLAVWGMGPGTPLAGLNERLQYLARNPPGWSLGWVVWMGCIPALLGFLAVLANRLPERRALAQFAVMLAVAGGAFDLFCDSVYLIVFPWLASRPPAEEGLFLGVERITSLGSLVVANGLYSFAILLLTVALRERTGLVRGTVLLGYAVAGSGLLLASAGFTALPWHAAAATGPAIGLYCVWVFFVARSFEPVKEQQ